MSAANATARREQSMEALATANRIRMGRAQVKRDLHAGDRTIELTLLDPPDVLESALVTEILQALPRWGAARAQRLMRAAAVGPSRRVGNLTDRERSVLILRLRQMDIS